MIMLGFTLPSTYLNNLYNVKSLNSCFLTRKNLGRKIFSKKRQQQKQNEMTDLQFNKIIKYKMKGIFKNVCMQNVCMYVCMTLQAQHNGVK